eukprot:7028186-Alexandrium_andersonii.AAC.1
MRMRLSRFQDLDDDERRAVAVANTRSLERNIQRVVGRAMNAEERKLLATPDPLVHHPDFAVVKCGDGAG